MLKPPLNFKNQNLLKEFSFEFWNLKFEIESKNDKIRIQKERIRKKILRGKIKKDLEIFFYTSNDF